MRRVDTSTPVVVLRLDHWGALGIVRSLGRLGVPVYGVHRSGDAPALRSRYCRGGFLWDLDEAPALQSVEYLLSVARSIGACSVAARAAGPPLLVPSNDETALFVAEHAEALRAAYRFQDNPIELVRALYDKRSMHGLARSLDLPTAETAFPTCRDDVLAFCASARFPVMLKGSDGIRLSRRSGIKMVRVRDAGELLARYDQLEDAASPDLMLQEYIPGGEDAQWMWNGYFNADSDCLFGVTARKLRQTPVYTGMTSLGVCLQNDEVDALTREFMRRLGYRGILDIGYRHDARDGRYKVLDVNPRVGATFRLFVGEGGMDVIRALYLDLTGQPIGPSAIQPGRKWLVEDHDLASSWRYRRDRVLSAGQWLRSLRGVRELAWFALDDAEPFRDMCAARARRALVKMRDGLRRRVQAARARASGAPSMRVTSTLPLPLVARHFDRSARYWKSVYEEKDRLVPIIYQARHRAVMRLVAGLALAPGARVLEVGCGAGHTALALARLGYRVHAIDASSEMVALTRSAAREAGLEAVQVRVGDALGLDHGGGLFDLVVAVGVLPWLESDARGLVEMARVLKPGGHLIATADSRARLDRLLDPRGTPLLAPLRSLVKRALALVSRHRPSPRLDTRRHHPRAVDRLVRAAGLHKVGSASVGFGPFSFPGMRPLEETTAVRVHRALQRLADDGWPLLRSAGSHYLVMARKPAS